MQVFEFSLRQKEYTPWSRALLKHGLHRLWLERDTPVTHISFSRRNAAHIFLHDAFMLCVIDQTLVGVPRRRPSASAAPLQTTFLFLPLCGGAQPFPEPAAMLYNQMTLRSLPESERSKHAHAFKICKNFQVFSPLAADLSRGRG